jgi:hypothetical protein
MRINNNDKENDKQQRNCSLPMIKSMKQNMSLEAQSRPAIQDIHCWQ